MLHILYARTLVNKDNSYYIRLVCFYRNFEHINLYENVKFKKPKKLKVFEITVEFHTL